VYVIAINYIQELPTVHSRQFRTSHDNRSDIQTIFPAVFMKHQYGHGRCC